MELVDPFFHQSQCCEKITKHILLYVCMYAVSHFSIFLLLNDSIFTNWFFFDIVGSTV